MLHDLRFRFRALSHRSKVEQEMDEELRFHLDQLTAKYRHRGSKPEEAIRLARLELGIEATREECRDARGVSWFEDFRYDLRQSLRQLGRSPAFTLTAVAILALGIGANSSLYSIIQAVLLRPLPYPDPQRLVSVSATVDRQPGAPVSPPDFVDWQSQSRSFESLAAMFEGRPVNLTGIDEPERISVARVSAGFFDVMGVRPLYGRVFSREEDQPGATATVVLDYDLWRRRFASNPAIVGTPVLFDGRACQVIGVMPRGFHYPSGQDGWIPLAVAGMQRWGRGAHVLSVVGRMRSGATIPSANAELASLSERIARDHPQTSTGWGAHVEPLRDLVIGGSRRALYILMAAVGMLLLIGCANVAGLLLARGAARSREMALRASLGATRGRMLRQLLTESLLLAVGATLGGLLLGNAILTAARPLLATTVPRADEIVWDGGVTLFSAALALVACLLFGMAPAWRTARAVRLGEVLGGAGRHASARPQRILRGCLVVAQVALSLVLLAAAGTLLKSVITLLRTDMGFDPENVLAFRVSWFPPAGLNPDQYGDAMTQFYDSAMERLRSVPGVESAAAVATLPLSGGDVYVPFRIEGDPPLPLGVEQRVDQQRCTADYFRVMRIKLLEGRPFDSRDTLHSPQVAIVNDAFARRFLAGREPLGQRVNFDDGHGERVIVGVATAVRHRSLTLPPRPEIYLSESQWPSSGMSIVVRHSWEAADLAESFRNAVREAGHGIPIAQVRTMDSVIAGSIAGRRLLTLLLVAFGAVALLLTATGLYGVIAYLTTQRTQEIGIRVALGARRSNIVGLVIRHSLALAGTGAIIGVLLYAALVRVFEGRLAEIRGTDPLAIAGTVALLLLVTFAACARPAWQAAKADPLTSLRCD